MNPNYKWTCHVCEYINESGTSNCLKCDFPAEASAIEIERAKSKGTLNLILEKRESNKIFRTEWVAQPAWIKILDLFSISLLILGSLYLKFYPWSFDSFSFPLIAFGFSFGLLWLTKRYKD